MTIDRQARSHVELHIEAAAAPIAPLSAPTFPGVVTWVGAGLSGVALIGVIGFGAATLSHKSEFDRTGSEDARQAGVTTRTLTNVSIGAFLIGAVLVALDFFLLSTGDDEPAAEASFDPDGVTLRF